MIGLHTTIWGRGEPVVFVHGSFSWGEEAFAEQRELADKFRLVLVDRRGFGKSPPAGKVDFEEDARDIVEILREGAHLVGHSYGGVVSLLAASLRPEAVWSLTVIEPPAFGLARGNRAVEQMIERIMSHYQAASNAAPAAFYDGFLKAWGFNSPGIHAVSDEMVRAIQTSRQERPPWEAQIPLDQLATAPFRKLVVSGGWKLAPPRAREVAGMAFNAVCDVLETKLGAERAVFEEAAHNPQLLGKPFNERLERFLRSARLDSIVS